MATILQISALDHGKSFSDDELAHAEYEPGFKYEVIQGALYVTPAADLPHDDFEIALLQLLWKFAENHPHLVGKVTNKARIFVPGQRRTTAPEPDIAVYRERSRGPNRGHWRDRSPFIVAEILSPGTDEKDLVRNVELYVQVPSILEYWVFDLNDAAAGLTVFRRANDAWQRLPIATATYQTDLLPGLSLPTRSDNPPSH